MSRLKGGRAMSVDVSAYRKGKPKGKAAKKKVVVTRPPMDTMMGAAGAGSLDTTGVQGAADMMPTPMGRSKIGY